MCVCIYITGYIFLLSTHKTWMEDVLAGEWRAKTGRLWSSVSNYYVKTLVGWKGESMCIDGREEGEEEEEEREEEGARCVNGVGEEQLAAAKEVLRTRFDVTLVTEWLSSEAQMEWLGRVFCFPTRPLARRRHRRFGNIAWPRLDRKAAPGGHAKMRPPDWLPSKSALARLEAWNRLDLELYRWAAERARDTMRAINATALAAEAAEEGVTVEEGVGESMIARGRRRRRGHGRRVSLAPLPAVYAPVPSAARR